MSKKIYYSKGVFLNIKNNSVKEWAKSIKFIKSLDGVEHIEIWFEYFPREKRELNFLISALEEYKILLHAPFVHLNLASHHHEINKATIKINLQIIKIAKKMMAKGTTFHGGSRFLSLPEKFSRNLIIKNLKYILDLSENSTPFAIENLPLTEKKIQINYPSSLKEMIVLKRKIPNLKFTLDIGHCLQNGENFSEFLRIFRDSIFDIHLHDGRRNGSAHLALGKGELNLNKFFSLLKDISYKGYLTLEMLSKSDIKKSWQILSGAI